jgi:antitoxin (DNA-binding transcriptional repressor) of toxin-antitoxin stability system
MGLHKPARAWLTEAETSLKNSPMKTCSVADARANLGKLCGEVLRGGEVAIVHQGKLVKLQPVEAVAELTDAEAAPQLDRLLASRARKPGRALTARDRKRLAARVAP